MSRLRMLWVALIPPILVVTAMLAFSGADHTAAQAKQTPTPSACLTGLQKWVEPAVVTLGDDAQVTMVVTGTCPAEMGPIDLVLLADVSNSMTKYRQSGIPSEMPPRVTPTATDEHPEPTPPGGNEPTPGSGPPECEPPFCNPPRQNEPTATPTPRRWPPWRPTPTPIPPSFSTPDINELEPAGDDDQIRNVQKWISDFLGESVIERDMAKDRLRVGLVGFDERVQVSLALTNERSKVATGVNRLRGGSITRINTGMREAVRVLNGTGARPDPRTKVIVILSDFQFCSKDMRNLGIDKDTHVFSVGFGVRDCDRRRLADLATQGSYVSERGSLKPLMDAYKKIFAVSIPVSVESMGVTDLLNDTMQLDSASVSPPPLSITGQQMDWRFEPPGLPLTITYRIVPQEVGRWVVSERAGIEFVDSEGRRGSGTFPQVEIEVLAHTPTPTHTPTASPTATETSTPMPTDTPTPLAQYLPILFRNWPPAPTATPAPTKCVPEAQLVSVALVIDTSTSMSDSTPGQTQSKLAAAIEAAQELVNQLKPVDMVAVIGFNNTAHVETTLTTDRAQIRAALQALPSRQAVGTRIDAGLLAALAELTSARHQPGYVRAVVLLTDGRHIGDPNDVVSAAAKVRDEGIALVTVGLGGDVDKDLLRNIANLYYEAPGSEELLRIYREIARYIPCPGEP